MRPDLFKNLPSELTTNIFSRLPVKATVRCKCVCKSWLGFIESPEFVNFHLSKSVPGLAVFSDCSYKLNPWPNPYVFFEFVDNITTHRCSPVFNFNLPDDYKIVSEVNGLLFLSDKKVDPDYHFVCNPITRDYIQIPPPDLLDEYLCECQISCPDLVDEYICECRSSSLQDSYGFGVSKISGQYKVVVIFHDLHEQLTECEVYTLGSGNSWRRIAIDPSGTTPLEYVYFTAGTFVNGNLHWQIRKFNRKHKHTQQKDDQAGLISCLDLETELFSIFSPPPGLRGWSNVMAAMEDSLVYCDDLSHENGESVFWFMNEYGNDKSWTKKYVISINDCYGGHRRRGVLCPMKVFRGVLCPIKIFKGVLCPIKVFKDGDILIVQFDSSKLFYSNVPEDVDRERKDSDIVELHKRDRVCVVSYTPSFLSLKTFASEDVLSF